MLTYIINTVTAEWLFFIFAQANTQKGTSLSLRGAQRRGNPPAGGTLNFAEGKLAAGRDGLPHQ